MNKYIFFLFIITFVSCDKDAKLEDVEKTNDSKTIYEDVSFKVNIKNQKLHSEAKHAVEDWLEYQNVSDFIPKFYNTSTKEALFNSIEFYKLTSFLKDSTKIERFIKPSVKTRINVLNNEALRLFDMDSITSITNKEIIHETNNIINAFNALNIKINNSVNRDLLTKDLSEFNHIFDKDSSNIEPINNKQKKIMQRKKRIKPLSMIK